MTEEEGVVLTASFTTFIGHTNVVIEVRRALDGSNWVIRYFDIYMTQPGRLVMIVTVQINVEETTLISNFGYDCLPFVPVHRSFDKTTRTTQIIKRKCNRNYGASPASYRKQ